MVEGADKLRAVLAVLADDVDCYDPVTGQTLKAGELYSRIAVKLLG